VKFNSFSLLNSQWLNSWYGDCGDHADRKFARKKKQLQNKELVIEFNTRDVLLVWNLWKEHRRESVL